MKLVESRFVRLDDDADRQSAREAGLQIKQTRFGWPQRLYDSVEFERYDQARKAIAELNGRACALRSKAKRAGAAS